MSVDIRNELENLLVTPELLHELESLVNEGLQKLSRPLAHVDITLAGEEEIQRLNREYRKIDAVTDVLSFALEEGDEEPAYIREEDEPELLGDIIICLPRALEQAEDYGHTFRRELGYLAVHGLLHLVGYDHATLEEQQQMRQQEEALLGASWGRD